MKSQVQFKINPKECKINQSKLFALEEEVPSESLAEQAETLMNKGIAHAEIGLLTFYALYYDFEFIRECLFVVLITRRVQESPHLLGQCSLA
jgi:hypothetical protein